MQASRSLGAYGVTLVLGLFGATGLVRGCAPPPPPTSAAINVTTDCAARINTARSNAGLAPVKVDSRITLAAEAHSTEQAQRKLMTHTGTNGSNAGQRLNVLGYAWRTWGENVAAGQGDCASVVSAWMNSAPHRANILNPAMKDMGIGAVATMAGTIYWTLDLAAPK